MTAETVEETTIKSINADGKIKTKVPPEIGEIFEFLSCNDSIVFKSQQVDDPELERSEKKLIAEEIYIRSMPIFLNRFGVHLQEKHIDSLLMQTASSSADKNDDEDLQLMLIEFRRKLKTRKLDVKNRRYAALQQLIRKGEYFSETEMMKRNPELYQELIGQHLSEQEKKNRDSYDVKNTTLPGILMHVMQQDEIKSILNEADESNKRDGNEETDSVPEEQEGEACESSPAMGITIEECDNAPESLEEDSLETYEVPASYRQQWGNFENETIDCSVSKSLKVVKPTNTVKPPKNIVKFITSDERDLLRQEFVGIMHEQFLAGLDKDFDYTKVDDNTEFDDLRQLDQDKEDDYFAESDDDVVPQAKSDVADESEDELDIFIQHLQKHPSIQFP